MLLFDYKLYTYYNRWCLVIGAALHTLYLAANINPIPSLLMIAACFSGIGAGVLWNAQSVRDIIVHKAIF